MVMLRVLLKSLPLASVTWKVILLVPAVVGVPLMTPVEALRERPDGRVPLVQFSGALPPEATESGCKEFRWFRLAGS